MKILWDASNHQLYPIGGDGFTSGTVIMVREIAKGLADRGHTVHVITNDLEEEEQRGPTLWYWPKNIHPVKADVAIQLMHVNPNADYDAKILLLSTFGIDPQLGPDGQWAEQVDGFPVLSEKHGELLRKVRPTVPAEKCFVTGLGVGLGDYLPHFTQDELFDANTGKIELISVRDFLNAPKVPGRLLFSNDPTRGLLPLLDIFDGVKKQVPEATLHITYDFDRNHNVWAWDHSHRAQMMWEMKKRVESTDGVVNLGAVDRATIIKEQLECQVHCMPSTAERDQLHGLSQMECAAAGAALVLSDVAAFPEVFGEGATIVPMVGKYIPELERRVTPGDYVDIVVELMTNPEVWLAASQKARALAEQNTWGKCIDRWEQMLEQLGERVS